MILFLDFDGVLHPARAVMGQHGPELAGHGSLFMWAEPLAELLAESPHVQIVLSTSWARHLPFERVRDFLPVSLRRRVVGSTWHRIQTDPDFSRGLPFSYWQDATRYQQVKRWANVHRLRRWVAVDDDAKGWDEPERLVQTDPETGLSDPAVVARLSELLRRDSMTRDTPSERLASAGGSVPDMPDIPRQRELLAAVPVHRQGGGAFVVLAEIPQPWRDQFTAALRGSAAPRIDGVGPCAWAWDWQQWVAGTWHQRPGPDGLTKWVIDGVEVERSSGNVFADLGLPEPEKLLRASRAHGQMVLVIDLEATCCDQGTIPPESMEIIEVGAAWATPAGEVMDTLQRFVRPTERPTLTPFCIELTHIEQASIDAAPSWPTVAAELAEFARLHAGQCWGSWGAYDRRQIERESARHGLADPLAGLPHQNLKAAFAKARKIKQVGMATALQIAGLELEGEHHRALADARNIARLLPWALG